MIERLYHGATLIVCLLPEPGETIVVRTDYRPWLLGFCRWRVERRTGTHGGFAYVSQTLREGRWKWRGRDAACIDSLVQEGGSR